MVPHKRYSARQLPICRCIHTIVNQAAVALSILCWCKNIPCHMAWDVFGAANGNRTRTVFGPRDFKSLVSTSSTMAACFHPIS